MTNPSLHSFCDWLKDTSFSVTLQTVEWIIPLIQTVHILAIAAVVGGALTQSLRVLRTRRGGPLGEPAVSTSFVMIWVALPVLLVTGALLVIAEPARDLENPVFALKMGLVVVAALVTLAQQRALRRTRVEGSSPAPGVAQRALALASLTLWVAIVFAGRLIAYVQSF
jgi:hypothetical protein